MYNEIGIKIQVKNKKNEGNEMDEQVVYKIDEGVEINLKKIEVDLDIDFLDYGKPNLTVEFFDHLYEIVDELKERGVNKKDAFKLFYDFNIFEYVKAYGTPTHKEEVKNIHKFLNTDASVWANSLIFHTTRYGWYTAEEQEAMRQKELADLTAKAEKQAQVADAKAKAKELEKKLDEYEK